MDIEKIRDLVEQMATAQAEYGSGWYSHEPWQAAYQRLLAAFGFGEEWKDGNADQLHGEYWDRYFAEIKARRTSTVSNSRID